MQNSKIQFTNYITTKYEITNIKIQNTKMQNLSILSPILLLLEHWQPCNVKNHKKRNIKIKN